MNYTLTKEYLSRDFSPFLQAFGSDFLLKIIEAYRLWTDQMPRRSEETHWAQLRSFFKYFASEKKIDSLRKFVRGEVELNADAEFMLWQNALSSYREHIDLHEYKLVTKDNLLAGPRVFICDFCANQGIVPHDLVLKGWNIDKSLGSGTTLLNESTLAVLGLSEDGLSSLVNTLDDDDVQLDSDLVYLLQSLVNHPSAKIISSSSHINIATRLLENRISQLKREAAKQYVNYIQATSEAADWCKNPEIIALATHINTLIEGPRPDLGSDFISPSYRLKAMVIWLKIYNSGLYPLYNEKVYFKFNELRKLHGLAREEIEFYLGKSRSGMVAGYTFILFETAGNSESIWSLSINDLVINDGVEESYRLNWIKRRSSGFESMSRAFTVRDAPLSEDTLTVKDVFEHQLECRKDFLKYVRFKDRDKLFLSWHKNYTKNSTTGPRIYIPTHPTSSFLRNRFSKLCEDASGGAWHATPRAIRGSLLLLEGILTRDATAVAELGQHVGLQMANRYTYHLPETLRREKNIRDFLDWFEALLTIDITEFAMKVGIDESLYSTRETKASSIKKAELEDTLNQQFGGIHCRDPFAGVAPDTSPGVICNKVEHCPTCDNRRGIFVLSQSNIANVMHWNEILELAERELSEDAFEKWRIWHIFTKMLLNRFSSNSMHTALIRLAARQQRKETNPYRHVIPMLEVP
ncbi:hypothetical protein [Oceanospirillum sanctuarii]|uniref:hypothetical protein n=1 Tax=Oceanospirillum sanctuarii TaxID=1434821 RepID=UPI000A38EB2D|nr:hypothetical protein [Oceanospirillum sanctuarii]